MSKDTKLVSFADLNLTASSETPFDLEIENDKGVKTGIVIKVIGSQSEKIKTLINENHNRQETKKALATRRSKDYFQTAEELDEFSIELQAARIYGWSGLDVDYSPEKARELMRQNQFIAMQVVNASNEVGNYNKS